ncbi:hypothetical protein STEG23_037115, partial [Scotinomys teguina]
LKASRSIFFPLLVGVFLPGMFSRGHVCELEQSQKAQTRMLETPRSTLEPSSSKPSFEDDLPHLRLW